ncbi:MAG: hypothetical protein GX146_01740 [Myxococcales bacterium]|nr:hypothetical protein [Myxococcales bacterium]
MPFAQRPSSATWGVRLIVALGLLVACHPRLSVDLATIHTVEPESLETGDVLRIRGEGFVEGPVQVTFDGHLRVSAFQAPQVRKVTLEGKCPNPAWVEVEMNTLNMAELCAESALFEGRVEVSFPTPLRQTDVRIAAEKTGVRLQLYPGGAGLAKEALSARAGHEALQGLGLRVDEGESGVQVVQVFPGTVAARHGVSTGARLHMVDGVAIHHLADVTGLHLEVAHSFVFVDPDGTERLMQTDAASFWLMPRDDFFAVLLTALALAFFFAFALRAPATSKGKTERPRIAASSAIGYSLGTIPALLLPLLSAQPKLSFVATAVLFSAATGAMLLAAVYSRAKWTARLFGFGAHWMAPVCTLGVGVWLAQAAGLAEVSEVQHRIAFGWLIFDNPLAMLVGLWTLALLWPSASRSVESPHPIETVAAWVFLFSGAALSAAFFFGGWPSGSAWPLPRALQLVLPSLVFAGKTLLIAFAARWLGRVHRSERRRVPKVRWAPYLRAGLLPLFAVGALCWPLLPLSASARAMGTALAFGGTGFFFFRLWLTALRRFLR